MWTIWPPSCAGPEAHLAPSHVPADAAKPCDDLLFCPHPTAGPPGRRPGLAIGPDHGVRAEPLDHPAMLRGDQLPESQGLLVGKVVAATLQIIGSGLRLVACNGTARSSGLGAGLRSIRNLHSEVMIGIRCKLKRLLAVTYFL